ncbi:hypothetical protein B0H16DRAFT_1661894 [Mycena metata]|uniref:RNase H type-1 domain-containing protein n=1 Tax=Mycena metata TaxID=1033252 RepID=A0AAD7JFC8_9AGAR|nr:hypothetical protein B0H16DRAFT_1661894 [Mycena metata]
MGAGLPVNDNVQRAHPALGEANKDLDRATLATMRQRKRTTKFKWVKGHNGHTRNEGADMKADEGVSKQTHDKVPLNVPPELKATGAKLSSMTQSLAYKAIRERRMKTKLKKRDKDLSRQIRSFLWTTAHEAYKERSICQHCGKIDSMEHILSQCEIPGQSEVWALAKELWTKRNPDWPWLGLGPASRMQTGRWDTRLYRILVTESAYLIWKLRGERIIQNGGKAPTEMEIHNRWVKTMNVRLQLDCSMTHPRYERKALPAATVLKTCKGILDGEAQLSDDWTGVSGVLVGIEPMRQQER